MTVSVSAEGWTDCAAHHVCHARGGGCVCDCLCLQKGGLTALHIACAMSGEEGVCVTVSVSTEGWTDCAAHSVCHARGGGCVCDCVCVYRRVD